MLKGISPIISPELLKVIAEMGHGDEIVIVDGNYPAASMARNGAVLVRADGHGVCEMMRAILPLMPLDTYAQPAYIMAKTPGDTVATPIWDEFAAIVSEHSDAALEQIERGAFYERSKKAYCILQTGETALYGNIILKKGVVVD